MTVQHHLLCREEVDGEEYGYRDEQEEEENEEQNDQGYGDREQRLRQ